MQTIYKKMAGGTLQKDAACLQYPSSQL